MDKNALKNKIAEILGIAVSEKDLAFEMMLNRLSEILNYDDAINIPGIGIFSLKKEPLLREERGENIGMSAKRNLIFLPEATDSNTSSKAMYLTFNLDNSNQDYLEFDENIFSISVGKPLVSASGIQSGASTDDSSEKMLATLEEKVQRLVANTEKISDYDIWNEFASKENVDKNIDDSIVDDSTDNDLKQMVSENVITQEITDEELIEEPEQSVLEENEADSDVELETENIESNSTETVEPDLPEEEITNDSVAQDENILQESEKEIEPEENANNEEADDTPGENEEINWDWGDELKEELEADNPEIDSTTEEKISDTTKETTSEDVKDNKKTAASELFESVDHSSEERDEEENNNDEQVEEELVENEEEKSKTATQTVIYSPGEFEEESAKRSKLDDIKKKFKFGKTLWMLIGAFVLIGLLGIYFMFFTGDGIPEVSQQNIPDTLIHKKLQPIENNSDIENSSNNNAELNSQKDKESSTVSTSEDVSKKEVKQLDKKNIVDEKSGSLYRSFPDEKQIRNLIFLQNGVYSVQVSSRRNKIKAEQYVKKLRNVGYNAFIVKTYLSKLKSTWYRVRVGYFNSVKEAMAFRTNNKF